MSFGFSVGDILGGASLAYKLYKALSETEGSAKSYQQLIAELNVVHKVLIQVEQLRVSNQLAQATVNAVLFITNSANEAMEVFLANHEKYSESLKEGGSGSVLKDSWRKWQWSYRMEAERSKLSQTLASMLVSINCLVQLACFFNTGYDPEVNVRFLNPHNLGVSSLSSFPAPFDNVKLQAWCSSGHYYLSEQNLHFVARQSPRQFFRPGQVFSLCISAELLVQHRSLWKHRRIESSLLPLEPIESLKAKYAQAQKDDRDAQLKQMFLLPLDRMVQHTRTGSNRKVVCTLCEEETPPILGKSYDRGDWAARHFRQKHWKQYCKIRGISPNSLNLPSLASYLPINSCTRWMTIEDVTSDTPVQEDQDIMFSQYASQTQEVGIPGAIMVRRFVVIQAGLLTCLCVGIHTYAGLGSSNQADQELFAILHPSKEVPMPFEKETGMVLDPIRMKPDHPSTALPSSSRVHFGRIYEISHSAQVKPLGLIHTGSMEKLISQSVAHAYRNDPDDSAHVCKSQSDDVDAEAQNSNDDSWHRKTPDPISDSASDDQDTIHDQDTIPADMMVVREMRDSIMEILGPDITLDKHWSPVEPMLSCDDPLDDVVNVETERERKRTRVI